MNLFLFDMERKISIILVNGIWKTFTTIIVTRISKGEKLDGEIVFKILDIKIKMNLILFEIEIISITENSIHFESMYLLGFLLHK